jgi:DNA-binding winged helix-turn-helix (wHTH) protein
MAHGGERTGVSPWIEELGEAEVIGGWAQVTLSEAFASRVGGAAYQVFLTSYAPFVLFVQDRTPRGFEIHALWDGRSSCPLAGRCAYRIVAVPTVGLPRQDAAPERVSSSLICYRFGSFVLQPGERRLACNGIARSLTARAFDLLVALVERAGHLVTKDELLGRVWSGVVVEEGNLAAQISVVRKALGAGAIETVAGRGYRFMLDVAQDEASTGGSALGADAPKAWFARAHERAPCMPRPAGRRARRNRQARISTHSSSGCASTRRPAPG